MLKNRKFIIILAVVAIVAGIVWGCISWGIGTRNNLVKAEEGVNAAWTQVENEYQRRYDLIPNLVDAVKAYSEHESSTYENVTRARAGLQDAYSQAGEVQQQGQPATAEQADAFSNAQGELQRALSIYVNAVREAYPDLKADAMFTDLMTQLEGTENRIAVERKRYIDTVQDFNIKVRTFPTSLIASWCGFETKPQFKAEQQAQTAPKNLFD